MSACLAALVLSSALVAEPVTLAPAAAVGATKGKPCHAPYRFERKNPTLQKALEKAVARAGWQQLIDDKRLTVALVDLTRPGKRYYAGINDNHMLYAASLPKIAILLAVIEAVNAGRLEWTHEFDRRLQNMIVASSNSDACWAIDLVGLLAIEKTLRNPRYCFYDEEDGGLWVGRAYRSGGAENRDPKHHISHGATARQVARFYAMLDAGRLVSRHWSFRMLGLMGPPKHFHKFVGGLEGQSGVAFLARKSGTWRNYHSDSVLVQHQGWRYVLVGISELDNGEEVMRELAGLADGIIRDGKHRVEKRPKVSRAKRTTKRN